MISYHMILHHIIWYQMIRCYIMWYHILWPRQSHGNYNCFRNWRQKSKEFVFFKQLKIQNLFFEIAWKPYHKNRVKILYNLAYFVQNWWGIFRVVIKSVFMLKFGINRKIDKIINDKIYIKWYIIINYLLRC